MDTPECKGIFLRVLLDVRGKEGRGAVMGNPGYNRNFGWALMNISEDFDGPSRMQDWEDSDGH